MSDSDRLLLTEIEREQAANAPRSKPDQYFEFFSAEQVLKKREIDLDRRRSNPAFMAAAMTAA